MQFDAFIQQVDGMHGDLVDTLTSKAHDYASNGDVLKNFRTIGSLIRILGINANTDIGYAFIMLLVKIQRLCNLIFSGITPRNESIDDSFRDLLGYTMLIYAIYTEDKNAV